MSTDDLTTRELDILLMSRKYNIEELVNIYQMSKEDINILLEEAKRKLAGNLYTTVMQGALLLPRPVAFRIEKRIGEPQIGTMKVGSKILQILSKGIYTATWNSLKELISNSFDADATKVEIIYNPLEKKLIVKDDGVGMDYNDFDKNFTFIVKSEKRKDSMYTPKYNRPIIGKIGIGFIAVSELCEKVKVISAKESSDTYFIADIDFSKIISKEAEDKEFYEVSQYKLINYEKKDINDHYTIIELIDLKQNFIDVLENKSQSNIRYADIKINTMEDLVKILIEADSVRLEFGPYWEFLLNLSNTIPIRYLEDGPIKYIKYEYIDNKHTDEERNKKLIKNFNEADNIIKEIKKLLTDYNFHVYLNGLELKKPIKFPHQEEAQRYGKDMIVVPVEKEIIINAEAEIHNVTIKCKGYFYYQRTRILPEELRGMLVRIKNVALGSPSQDYWEHPFSGDTTYFPQTFGEIYILEGLEDAMNIDRSTFKTTHAEYSDFSNFIHSFLRSNVFQEAKRMYNIRRSEKANYKEVHRINNRTEVIKEIYGPDFSYGEVQDYKSEPVELNKKLKEVSLNTAADFYFGFDKKDRQLLQDIAIALEIVLENVPNNKELKTKFWNTFRKLTEYRKA